MAKRIRGLPSYVSFGYSGLAYFNGNLYATTNLGLFEFHDGELKRTFCPQKSDRVTSGPWIDAADHLLWIQDDATFDLLNFDGTVWHRMKMPEPAKGYLSRGDVLEGSKMSGSSKGFWLAAGDTMWRWNNAGKTWDIVAASKDDFSRVEYSTDLRGVMAVGDTPMAIIEHQRLSFLSKEEEENFHSDRAAIFAGQWNEIPNADKLRFATDSSTGTRDAGIVCTRNGRIVRISLTAATVLDSPGICETVAVSSNGDLLASFRSRGIYSYEGGKWKKLLDAPYSSGSGEYWAHLASMDGEVAYAIYGKPVTDQSRSRDSQMEFTHNAPTKLWTVRNGVLKEVVYQ